MDLGTGSAGVLLALSDSGRSGEWGSWMPVLENFAFPCLKIAIAAGWVMACT